MSMDSSNLVVQGTTTVMTEGNITLHYKGTTINVPINIKADLKDVPDNLQIFVVKMLESKMDDLNVFMNI